MVANHVAERLHYQPVLGPQQHTGVILRATQHGGESVRESHHHRAEATLFQGKSSLIETPYVDKLVEEVIEVAAEGFGDV